MAATFNGTSQIFTYMDRVVTDFVAANLSVIITAITPVIALGLTISLMMEGLFLMARPGQEPLTSLVEPGITSGLLGATTLFCTVLMCGMGAGLILMAKFMLGIVVIFGPMFIFALLFKGTAELFGRWVATVINYGMVTVLVAAVFGLL